MPAFPDVRWLSQNAVIWYSVRYAIACMRKCDNFGKCVIFQKNMRLFLRNCLDFKIELTSLQHVTQRCWTHVNYWTSIVDSNSTIQFLSVIGADHPRTESVFSWQLNSHRPWIHSRVSNWTLNDIHSLTSLFFFDINYYGWKGSKWDEREWITL